MAYEQKIINSLDKFAKNLKPTHTVMAIAAVKGIGRPALTMRDKHEKPETKKYTALREGITEAVAIPIYWFCGEAAGCGAKLLKTLKDKHVIEKAKKNAAKTGDILDLESLKQPAHITEKIANNLRFLGVCTAALVVIPATCSIVIKPIVDKIITPPKTDDKPHTLPALEEKPSNPPLNKISRISMYSFINGHGLKVGRI